MDGAGGRRPADDGAPAFPGVPGPWRQPGGFVAPYPVCNAQRLYFQRGKAEAISDAAGPVRDPAKGAVTTTAASPKPEGPGAITGDQPPAECHPWGGRGVIDPVRVGLARLQAAAPTDRRKGPAVDGQGPADAGNRSQSEEQPEHHHQPARIPIALPEQSCGAGRLAGYAESPPRGVSVG